MRAPSIKTLKTSLRLTTEQANQIRGLIRGEIDPETYASAAQRAREAYHPHNRQTLIMEALDEILEGYGVEYIASAKDRMDAPDGIDYVNMGDTYAPTLMYDHRSDIYRVGDWGTVVECQPRRFA